MRTWNPPLSHGTAQQQPHSRVEFRPLVVGHRGAKGHLPENTLPSIERAIELGAEAVEIDVHRVEDKLVVIHDETVDRTTNGHGSLDAMTLQAVRALDAGNGARIPFLEEVIECVAGRVLLDIELKGADTATLAVEAIRRTVSEGRMHEDEFIVSSFDHLQLKQVRELEPSIGLLPLLFGVPHDLAAAGTALGCKSIAPNVKHLDGPVAADARTRGLGIYVWTANEPTTISRCIRAEVTGIISDFPERVVAQLKNK